MLDEFLGGVEAGWGRKGRFCVARRRDGLIFGTADSEVYYFSEM